jgi:hypothetical protein
MRTPFEKNYNLKFIFFNKKWDLGLYLRLRPKAWLRTFWGHPEADVIWYGIGPFDFFRTGFKNNA